MVYLFSLYWKKTSKIFIKKRHRLGIRPAAAYCFDIPVPPFQYTRSMQHDRTNHHDYARTHREIALHLATGDCRDDSPAFIQCRPSVEKSGFSSRLRRIPLSHTLHRYPISGWYSWFSRLYLTPYMEVRLTILFESHYIMGRKIVQSFFRIISTTQAFADERLFLSPACRQFLADGNLLP